MRILFIFDPWRNVVLLVAGDKSGQWNSWYRRSIPVAEENLRAVPEHGTDITTATLARYASALGGHLYLGIRVGDESRELEVA
ncbi:type II toxin-antitoxin system RelE/ParE family toxin [Amycolatopsis pigmentata]|uniref:Type II toxin-antitoxin system RelE/ParE family toxin n=1 Tax=Amycolatopsis pigmentata TaxID=450801 RepID=A0ABW5FRV0_9PSEU